VNNKLLRQYVSLQKKKRLLQERLDTVNKDIGRIESNVWLTLNKAGVDTITVNGMSLSPKLESWVKLPPELAKSEIALALKHAGLSHYVGENFNSSKLSAYIREEAENHNISLEDCEHLSDLEERGIKLPKSLQAVNFLGISTKIKVNTRLS
jgi:hypothetical protein